MVTKPEVLVTKKEMLVALKIVSSLATISVAILSLGVCMLPCKSKGLNWPFLRFSAGLL